MQLSRDAEAYQKLVEVDPVSRPRQKVLDQALELWTVEPWTERNTQSYKLFTSKGANTRSVQSCEKNVGIHIHIQERVANTLNYVA